MIHPGESTTDDKFREALALHRQSRIDEAAAAYRQVLEREPRHVQALTFLGVIAFQYDQFERALEYTGRALMVDPQGAGTHLMQGHALARLARDEAAVASYDRVIALNPGLADAFLHRADALDRLGRHSAALSSYDRALELKPDAAEIHNNRGNALRSLKRYEAAIVSYEKAIAISPHLPEPYFNRGLALHELKHLDAAVASFDQAIAVNPRYAEACYGRGNALKDMRQLDAALSSYDRAISLRADYAEAYSNRGNVLGELEDFAAALASYERAMSLSPDNADTYCNRGKLLCDLGRHQEALTSLDRALAIDPDHANAHFTRAILYLLLGDLEKGWREFEWRWKNEHCVTSREWRNLPQPLWQGEEVLDGKTILVHCEQGLGDTIQFCRYAKRLAERGGKVIFEVPRPLHELFRSLQGVAELVAQGDALPPFEYHCPLLSLPLAFGTTLDCVPSEIRYLSAKPERVRHWMRRLGERTKTRVGLVWSAGVRPDLPGWSVNDRRNIPLEKLAALRHPGIEFHSLQKGHPAQGELTALMANEWDGPTVVDHGGDLHDFEETAALIEQLDLVISVDTSTAHLAGALGKPVWILARHDACWRWLRDRTDSPWYPSVRLYRQRQRGDWEGVVQQVRRDLEHVAAEGEHTWR